MKEPDFRRLTTRESFFEWADQISNWTTKADMTFSWNCNEFDAKKKFEGFMRKWLPSSTYLYAIERDPNQHKVAPRSQGFNQSCHIHAITDTNWHWLKQKNVYRRDIWKAWFDRYGRNAIVPVNHKEIAIKYAMKKVFGYSEAREVPNRVCRRGTTDWNLVFGLGKAGRLARERAKSIEIPEYKFECV